MPPITVSLCSSSCRLLSAVIRGKGTGNEKGGNYISNFWRARSRCGPSPPSLLLKLPSHMTTSTAKGAGKCSLEQGSHVGGCNVTLEPGRGTEIWGQPATCRGRSGPHKKYNSGSYVSKGLFAGFPQQQCFVRSQVPMYQRGV